jgi:hypothetical protein
MPAPGSDGSQLDQRGRSLLGENRLMAKRPEGSRQPEGGLEPGPMPLQRPRSKLWTRCDLRFWFAGRDRSCPLGTRGS